MTWIDFLWPMVTGACLTLALINLRLGFAGPRRAAHLCFALSAFAVAFISGVELALMHADSPARYAAVLFWGDISTGAILASLTAFIWVFFGTGNMWLALAGPGLHAVGLLSYPVRGVSPAYLEITGLRTMETFGGANYQVAVGVPNPWNAVNYSAVLLVLVFVVDASVRLWRRGTRRRVIVVGGSLTFFLLAAGLHSALVEEGIVRTPYLISWFYLGILLAMGHELTVDVFAAAELSRQLRESEGRMSLAAESANLGLWVWDIARDEVWGTPRFRSMLGFLDGEHITFAVFRERVHPDDRASMERNVRGAVEKDLPYDMQYRLILPDASQRWIAAAGRVEHAEGHAPARMHGVCRDITKRRHAQLETQQLRQEIAHVGRVSMMGQLASALAHEINQPLGAILRNAEAAELFMQKEAPNLDEIRAILADIRTDDQRASSVINRMRGLLKRHDLETKMVDVAEIVDSVAVLARPDAVARQVNLDVEIPPDLPPVRGDRVHLQQVLLNLVLNGMDALNGAGSERQRVLVTARRQSASCVEIAVADTGHGIAAEKLASVFDPFFTTKPNGMGMGLPISRTIIEAHGGRLWAEGNRGPGATFRFTLNIAEAADAS
jgi:two-component system, LuxR family, sensor kinase FixL